MHTDFFVDQTIHRLPRCPQKCHCEKRSDAAISICVHRRSSAVHNNTYYSRKDHKNRKKETAVTTGTDDAALIVNLMAGPVKARSRPRSEYRLQAGKTRPFRVNAVLPTPIAHSPPARG